MSLRILENEILRKMYEESVSINMAIVERLKREGKNYSIMENSVIQDERLLKHVENEALKKQIVDELS